MSTHCAVSVSPSVGNCFRLGAKYVLEGVASSCNASELVVALRCVWCPYAGRALVYPSLASARWARGIFRNHVIPICMQFHEYLFVHGDASNAFGVQNFRQLQPCCRAQTAMSSQSTILNAGGDQESLLIRTLRGDDVDRSPVWMMRQAGRYMKVRHVDHLRWDELARVPPMICTASSPEPALPHPSTMRAAPF